MRIEGCLRAAYAFDHRVYRSAAIAFAEEQFLARDQNRLALQIAPRLFGARLHFRTAPYTFA